MFSQLCRARPRTLWDKFSVRPPATREHRSAADEPPSVNNSEVNVEDSRCQLEHCTFCDYRVCCEVVSHTPEELASCEWDLKVTENPAYGLSIKNWLETDDDQEEDCESSDLSSVIESTESSNRSEDLNKENSLLTIHPASQHDCDANTKVNKMNQFNIPNRKHIQGGTELKPPRTDASNERLKTDNQKSYDPKQNGVTWSVFKHRQTCVEAAENCDKTIPNVIEPPVGEKITLNSQSGNPEGDFATSSKFKWNKDKSFPLSLMKPLAKMGDKKTESHQLSSHTLKGDLSRQKPVEKNSRDVFQNPAVSDDRSKRFNKVPPNDPLAEIAQIKTEESIQEWLARISDSGNATSAEDSNKEKTFHGSAWDLRSDEAKELKCSQQNYRNETEISVPNKAIKQVLEQQSVTNEREHRSFETFYPEMLQEEEDADTTTVLCNASKVTPANIPMVVMQCSRLHSHIGSKPPFQQTSLPMGTLVTALYQESEWLYVQTPHGVEGFISASNCVPIGTINDPAPISRRPWEPCDFPIKIGRHKKEEFARQQGSYIQTKLPINGSRQSIPYISTVKMKTNFYNDRYFSNTFKTKDSIKIAKTVTDILRSSPETKVSH